MVAAFRLENFGLTHGTKHDWRSKLPANFLLKSFLAAGLAMPRLSTLEANWCATLRALQARILHRFAAHLAAAAGLHTEARHHVDTICGELLELRLECRVVPYDPADCLPWHFVIFAVTLRTQKIVKLVCPDILCKVIYAAFATESVPALENHSLAVFTL